jgi:hypothetical protein
VPVPAHEIDLAFRQADVAGHDSEAVAFQERRRGGFSRLSQGSPLVHGA